MIGDLCDSASNKWCKFTTYAIELIGPEEEERKNLTFFGNVIFSVIARLSHLHETTYFTRANINGRSNCYVWMTWIGLVWTNLSFINLIEINAMQQLKLCTISLVSVQLTHAFSCCLLFSGCFFFSNFNCATDNNTKIDWTDEHNKKEFSKLQKR